MKPRVAHPSRGSLEATIPRRTSPKTAAPAAAHPVLSRLTEEVRNERSVEASYDRVHNRHNRGR